MELVIAAVLLSGVVAGLMRAFTTAQGFTPVQVAKSGRSNTGRAKLENLYESVRQDWWSDIVTAHPLTNGTHDTDSGSAYIVNPVNPAGGDATEDYRKVEVTVSS